MRREVDCLSETFLVFAVQPNLRAVLHKIRLIPLGVSYLTEIVLPTATAQ